MCYGFCDWVVGWGIFLWCVGIWMDVGVFGDLGGEILVFGYGWGIVDVVFDVYLWFDEVVEVVVDGFVILCLLGGLY